MQIINTAYLYHARRGKYNFKKKAKSQKGVIFDIFW